MPRNWRLISTSCLFFALGALQVPHASGQEAQALAGWWLVIDSGLQSKLVQAGISRPFVTLLIVAPDGRAEERVFSSTATTAKWCRDEGRCEDAPLMATARLSREKGALAVFDTVDGTNIVDVRDNDRLVRASALVRQARWQIIEATADRLRLRDASGLDERTVMRIDPDMLRRGRATFLHGGERMSRWDCFLARAKGDDGTQSPSGARELVAPLLRAASYLAALNTAVYDDGGASEEREALAAHRPRRILDETFADITPPRSQADATALLARLVYLKLRATGRSDADARQAVTPLLGGGQLALPLSEPEIVALRRSQTPKDKAADWLFCR